MLERVADWDSRICGYVVRTWIEWRGYLVGKNERRTFMVDLEGMIPCAFPAVECKIEKISVSVTELAHGATDNVD